MNKNNNTKLKNNKKQVYLIAAITLLLDQILKLIVKSKLSLNEEISVIKNFFSIHYLQNDGAAFSILENKTILLILISFICLGILIYYIQKEKNFTKIISISLGLILGGIIGNLLDRILYKKVLDFISFTFFSYNFPVFNIADIGITIGTFLLLFSYLQEELKNSKKV